MSRDRKSKAAYRQWLGQPLRRCVACGLALFPLTLLFGCEGIQSVMDPASRDARLVAELSWWMFASAVFIYIVTIGLLAVGAGLFRDRAR